MGILTCSGGGGDTPVIYQGHVFAPDFWGTNVILDSNGNALGSFRASAVPAFENGLGFFLAGSTLEAHYLNGMVKWIRKKLGRFAASVETEVGHGYRFERFRVGAEGTAS